MFAIKGPTQLRHVHQQPLGPRPSTRPVRSGNRQYENEDQIDRRDMLHTAGMVLSVVGVSLVVPEASYALGKSPKELAKASRARREKLKETARLVKEKGAAKDAFASSNYEVSEEAKTPNAVNRNKKD